MKVEDDYFEVRLSFSNIPELLVIPYSAVKVFFDPSVPYGLQFDQTQRPEAVEDKTSFLEDHWQMQSDNIETPFGKATMDDISQFNTNTDEAIQRAEAELNIEEEIANFPQEADPADQPDAEEQSEDTEADSAEIVSLDAFRKNK